MPITDPPGFSLVAHIRRLSATGSVLYIRIDKSCISRLGLKHGQPIEVNLDRVRITGVVKTSGGSPWLAPVDGSSNAVITATLRGAGFEHGMDAPATVRSLNDGAEPSRTANYAPARAVAQKPLRQKGGLRFRFTSDDAIQAVREYNRGLYRGRSNIDLDREAYGRFRKGLSNDLEQLTDQIAFVGEKYGGAQERFLPHNTRAEAALIARNLHRVMGQWLMAVTGAKPLIRDVPDESTLDSLFSPFTGTMRWGVWASKTLHFLRPDVFPILDSNAKKPLGLRHLGGTSRDYHQFCFCLRHVLLDNSDAMAAARTADAGESPSDLKLLDKILFQLGLAMK